MAQCSLRLSDAAAGCLERDQVRLEGASNFNHFAERPRVDCVVGQDIHAIAEPVLIQARRARVLTVSALAIIVVCLVFIVLLIAL